MWLLAGQKAPDHSTIARFRTGFLADACEDLFYQMVKRLENAGELSKETVFIEWNKTGSMCEQIYFRLEKIRREMGNKNVPEDTGCSFAFKSGIHTKLSGN